MTIGDWIAKPINDAWSLQKLALSQRHCGHRFIEGCINGTERLFIILNLSGKVAATVRLTFIDQVWSVGDIKGFANLVVNAELNELGITIANLYTAKVSGG